MFTRPEIAAAAKALVLVELYTDGDDPVSKANQKVEEEKFATSAIPLYALMTPDEVVVASFEGQTNKTAEFLAFLKSRPGGTLQSSIGSLPRAAR
jgi:hypothetical protein